ncbi:MAG: protein-glutamate O-methyltransferase CheR [Pseudomonadota bacterium]
MRTEDFEYLRKFLYDRSGLALTPDKSYLLESRLAPIARRLKHKTLADLIAQMRIRSDEALTIEVVEAMTTNETLFFRDRWPFERFSQMILPAMIDANKATKRIRIWCAACSSGQEPYSLAMLLCEASHLLAGWQVELVGTDISEEMLERCRKGWYSAFEVQRGMTPDMLRKYFTKDGDGWQINDKLRSMVKFRNFNLLADPGSSGVGLTGLDLIFCRNVLIYFDEVTRKQVFTGMAKAMKPAGFLCLGGAETVIGISDAFRILPGERGLFAVNGPAGAAGGAVAQTFPPRPALASAPVALAAAPVAARAPITAFASRPATAAGPAAPPLAARPAPAPAPLSARASLDPRPIEAMLAAVARLA